MPIAKNATLIESTNLYSIYIASDGSYTIQRHRDQKDLFLQGDTANLFGMTLGEIRSKVAEEGSGPENLERKLDWLCASEFGE